MMMASPDTSKLADDLPHSPPASYSSGKRRLYPMFVDFLESLWEKTKTKMKMKRKTKMKLKGSPMAWMKIYPRFKLEELRKATNNFDPDRIINESSSFTLYQGSLNFTNNEEEISGKIPVSIMRFKQRYDQWNYLAKEMELLSNLHHPNIVSPMGYYINDGSESGPIIVHSPTPNGTLHDHLHNKSPTTLLMSWKRRLQICIGVARGLECLHTTNPLIIHRDIRSSHILLDRNWVPKISNFQISKVVSPGLSESDEGHLSMSISCASAYWDPEYYLTSRVTLKSDVYSFGVVLFEVLCGRKPLEFDDISDRYINWIFWARERMEEGRVDEITDPRIKGEIEPECLTAYVDLVYKCLNERGDDRPTMGEVVKRLQLALLLQECIEANVPLPSWLTSIIPSFMRRNEPWSASRTRWGEPLVNVEERWEISDGRWSEPTESIQLPEIPRMEIEGSVISDDYDMEDLPR